MTNKNYVSVFENKKAKERAEESSREVPSNINTLAQNTYSNVQNKIKSALQKNRSDLSNAHAQNGKAHRAKTQNTISQSAEQAQKNLAKTFSRVKHFAAYGTENIPVAETLDQAQESVRQVQKKLQKGTGSTIFSQKREPGQDTHMQHQRQRQRARTLFRIGILTGIVITLAFTPISGKQVRRNIKEQWQKWNISSSYER
jgi:ribosomal protein L9